MSIDRSDKHQDLEADLESQRRPSYLTASEDNTRLPSLAPSKPSIASRWQRRLRNLPGLSRTVRLLRWGLGPSIPVPDDQIAVPSPSLALSLTLGGRSWRCALDPTVRRLTTRLRLRYALYPFLALWFAAFVLLTRQQYYNPTTTIIGCDAALWDDWPPDICGLNGTSCEANLVEGSYRCMGNCQDVKLGNPRWVGDQYVNGVPLVIGGTDGVYRADSWACPSAIHAGLIAARYGGCITIKPLPFESQATFAAAPSHGISPTSFLPTFPGAYTLESTGASCIDLHVPISVTNALCLFILTVFLAPPTPVLYGIVVFLGYFQLTLISDPANQPPDWESIIGGFLPVAFTAYWAWKISFKRTMSGFRDLPLELGLWQGGGYWLGIESSTIFAHLPTLRIGYDAINGGAVIFIAVICILAGGVVIIQALQLRKYGQLTHYIKYYIPIVPLLLALAWIPNYTLRLHHYLFALVGIPVLSLPNRVSLFCQAFLLGLFMDGVCRWGWASILQYTASLVGDAVVGTGTPIFNGNASSVDTVAWWPLSDMLDGYEGVMVMVDDILHAANVDGGQFHFGNLTLQTGIDHFFRLAYVINGTTEDYTDPITLFSNGSWNGS